MQFITKIAGKPARARARRGTVRRSVALAGLAALTLTTGLGASGAITPSAQAAPRANLVGSWVNTNGSAGLRDLKVSAQTRCFRPCTPGVWVSGHWYTNPMGPVLARMVMYNGVPVYTADLQFTTTDLASPPNWSPGQTHTYQVHVVFAGSQDRLVARIGTGRAVQRAVFVRGTPTPPVLH